MSEKIPGLAKYLLWPRADAGNTVERSLFDPSLEKNTMDEGDSLAENEYLHA